MTDRLEEITAQHNRGGYAHRVDCRVCWLIAEVERLRKASWRCFHCNETFETKESAEAHFGKREDNVPCECIATTHPLVVRLRDHVKRLEGELEGMRHSQVKGGDRHANKLQV